MTSNSLAVYTPEKQREVLELMGFKGTPQQISHLFRVAERYELDPILKEVSLIPGKGTFVGVWGRFHVAHRSGLLDGLEMDEEVEDDRFYKVKVIVWRKDQSRPAAKVWGRVAKSENKDWPYEIARARALRAALGYAFSIHDAYDSTDEDGDWTPPPDERRQASEVDVPAAASPREEAPAQTAAKPKKRVTKADRGSAADPDPTPGHTGVSSGPPPGSPAADPQPSGVAVETGAEAAPTLQGRGPSPAAPDTDPPTLVVGGHILAQKIAIAARHAGIDDDETRHDVIQAATGGVAARGHDVTDQQAPRVLAAFAGLADGSVELRYKPDGTPTLVKPRRP